MTAQHADLAAGRWRTLTLAEQLGNVGSEVSRARRWKDKDPRLFDGAMARALELLDLSLADPRWRRRLKEIARARELLCAAWLGSQELPADLEGLDRYFFQFALVARR